MTQSNLQQNLFPSDPQLKDLLDLYKKDILLGLNCHHIGTIQSFDPLTQTAQVTMNYTKTFFLPNALGNYTAQQANYPVILQAPVIILGGGNGAITFPIAKGDECLILFNDRDIDNWWSSGSTNGPVATGRLHSFSDAVVLVGLRSVPNILLDYNSSKPEFRTKSGLTKVTLDDSSIVITSGLYTITLSATGTVIDLGTTKLEISVTGQLTIKNITGDFVTTLVKLFTDIGACVPLPGFPLGAEMPTYAADLATLTTFMPV